jgi:ssDNA-binding Zn-finger/Zn-ribbon topoisomerase 1
MLLDKKAPGLDPVFEPKRNTWVSYPEVESALHTDSEYAVQLLEDLTRLGYLARHFQDKVTFCPACNSQDITLYSSCPKCGSRHIIRQTMLKHLNCGFIGAEEDYNRGEGRVCPKCRLDLVLIGSDYQSLGQRYRCLDCGTISEQPVERWHCRTCGRDYARPDIREVMMYAYVLDPSQVGKLKGERIPKARVREFLTREGYAVEESVSIAGKSGSSHQVDMIGTKRTGPLEHRIIVSFANAETEVASEEVIKLYAVAYDVDANETILIASPRLSDDARQFAKHYNIRVYNADELDAMGTEPRA